MENLISKLMECYHTSEPITIAYSGGNRPGEAIRLRLSLCNNYYIHACIIGENIYKKYLLTKIIWIGDSHNNRIYSCTDHDIPEFKTLYEYNNRFKPEIKEAGWDVLHDEISFSVGNYKYGTHEKIPSVAIRFIDFAHVTVYNKEISNFVEVENIITGNEESWRVDSWRFKKTQTYTNLHDAFKIFLTEIRESSPSSAKGMFAGH